MKRRIAFIGVPAALIVGSLWAALLGYAHYEQRRIYDSGLTSTGNLAIAFEENVQSILTGADWALRQFRSRYLADLENGGDGVSALSQETLPPIAFQLSFVDANGLLRYSNLQGTAQPPVNLSDREHFRVHLDPAFNGMFVSRPIYGRVSGVWSVQLSMRISAPNGRMIGVLVMSVDRRRFTDLFDRIDVGKRGNITLLGLDRWIRARASIMLQNDSVYDEPLDDRPFFNPNGPDAGFYRIKAKYDNEDRFGAYRKVRGYPLVVAALYSYPETMGPLEAKIANLKRVAALASAAVIVLALFIGFLQTKRDQARRELAENEARWRLALESVGDSVWDWRPQTDAVTYSPAWTRMVGCKTGDLPANASAWRSRVHPDDLPGVDQALTPHMAGTAPLFVHEYRLRRDDGVYIWVLDRAVAVERAPDGAPTRVLGICSDITQRRQLEQDLAQQNIAMQRLQTALAEREIAQSQRRLSEAQRVARLGVMEKTADDGAVAPWRFNPHALDLLGLPGDAADLSLALSLAAALAHVDADSRTALTAALENFPAARVDLEFPVHFNGETRFLHAIGDGADGDVFIMLQDVTARRNVEKEREQIRARVEENSRMEALGALAAGVAHEINTPAQFVGDNLAFLQSGTETLLELARLARLAAQNGVCPPEMAERLAEADLEFLEQEMPAAAAQGLNGVERISAIVRAVKEFCHPSAKEPVPFDLNHMAQSVATVTRNSWKYVADLTLDLDPNLPQAMGIEGEINQVLVNLIVNAAQAVGEARRSDPGRIVVSTRFNDQEIILSVTDDGVGVPPDKHAKIFELFYTTKPPGAGTGQGLAVSASIMRRHGGRITVISDVGQGARFDVHLPRPADENSIVI